MPSSRLALATATLAFAALAPAAQAFNIVIDYSYDTGNYFSNATAKAALEAAASDLSSALTNSLGAVSSDTFTGTNGDTTAEFDWKLTFTNPTTGATEQLETFSFGADEYRVFVGARLLGGSTLGQGGAGGAGISLTGGGFEEEWIGAMAAAESASNAAMLRGSGPQIGHFTGSADLGGTTANYDLRFGLTVGNLWFDTDANWHFDHTTAVAPGASDFYSVALHELIHSLGVGASDSWNANKSGTTWLGAEGIAEKGTGVGFLNPAGDHLASGTISSTVLDGTSQEVVMDPEITTGTRKLLTDLDLAVLRDMGFETSAIPEPAASAALAGAGLLAFACARRRRRA